MASCAEEADLDHALAAADTGGDSLYAYIDLPKVSIVAGLTPQVHSFTGAGPGTK